MSTWMSPWMFPLPCRMHPDRKGMDRLAITHSHDLTVSANDAVDELPRTSTHRADLPELTEEASCRCSPPSMAAPTTERASRPPP
jgi:hypothetical protein